MSSLTLLQKGEKKKKTSEPHILGLSPSHPPRTAIFQKHRQSQLSERSWWLTNCPRSGQTVCIIHHAIKRQNPTMLAVQNVVQTQKEKHLTRIRRLNVGNMKLSLVFITLDHLLSSNYDA